MKKTLFTLIVLFVSITTNGELVSRQKVVVEIGTATWCSPCQGAAMGAEDLIANGHDVAVIKYHSSGCPFTNQHSNTRLSYYGVTSIPRAIFDGVLEYAGGSSTQSMYPQYLELYNQRIDVPSPFTVAIDLEYTSTLNYNASVLVTQVSQDYEASELVLHFAVTETDIPHNWYNQTHVKDVLRTMVPGPSGTPLDFSTNDEQLVDLSFTLQEGWVQKNISVVAFVQDVQSKEIFQADIFHLETILRTVTFDIKDNDGNEITDAVVTFGGVENEPGDYVFEGIPVGDYEYKVEKEGYYTVEDEVTVDGDITIEIEMEAIPTYTVTFDIKDENGIDIENAVVTLGDVENPPGDYVFEDVEEGDYEYKVEKEGYYTVEDDITVDEDLTVEVVMEAIPVFTVTFEVLCQLYGDPLEDALVTFDDEEYFTDENGIVLIEDVYPGEYYYSVAKEEYITEHGQVAVDDKDVTVVVELVLGEDPEYDVVFNIMVKDGGAIEGAVVTFDENEYTTGVNGQVIIEDVLIGTYEYIVTKPGYLPEEGIAEVWDENVVIDVTLLAELFTLTLSAYPKEAGIVYGEGEYKLGDEVTISVESTCECWHFCCWYGDTEHVDDIYSTTATVTMPAKDIYLTASFCINTVKEISRVNIIVFPNPARNNFTVRSNEMIKQIRLVNISGQVIKDVAVNDLSTDINVSNLHPGVYFLQIHTAATIITERVKITR